jgi:hypothetical protein
MSTYTEVLPAQKSSPHNAINWTPAEQAGCGTLVVHTARASVAYAVTEFGTAWEGRAFHLVKEGRGTDPESSAYDVFIHRGGQDHQCSCAGFAYGRGKPCKHILAGLAVIENGWDRRDLANGEQDVSSTEPPF